MLNETDAPRVYSSRNENWWPVDEAFSIPPGTEKIVPYSPSFQLSSPNKDEVNKYHFEFTREILRLFDIKWNETKYLSVAIKSGGQIFLREPSLKETEQVAPFPLQPQKQHEDIATP